MLGAVLLLAALILTPLGCTSKERSPEAHLLEVGCGVCHSTETPLSKRKTLEGWRRTVNAMRARGARISDEEAEKIVNYLYRIRPKDN
ncbi:MAG: hypothetical protein C0608_06825 [Deltaproteobacteria bacterium]|nr:MAG: hypothetical protein C0608_06825 [Deltaproteobacteria bacterium]